MQRKLLEKAKAEIEAQTNIGKQQMKDIKVDIQKDDTFTYLNLTLLNPSTNGTIEPAKFDTNLTQVVVQDPKNWVAAVQSFNIPSTTLPLFEFIPNSYSVTLSYAGTDYQELLIYVPYSSISVLNNFVFYAQQFLDSVNNALNAAFTALITANPGVVNAAPYIVYNDGKLTLYADGLNYDVNSVTPVSIYFNESLFTFFSPMQTFFNGINLTNGKDAQILVKDNGNGSSLGTLTGTVFAISTEYNALSSWSYIKSIAVLSNMMGIKANFLLTNSVINGHVNNNLYQAILASVDIVLRESKRNTYVDYEPRFLSFNDITTSTPLSHVDFRFVYLTKNLDIKPINLLPGESANIVIQFKNRSILS